MTIFHWGENRKGLPFRPVTGLQLLVCLSPVRAVELRMLLQVY
jgi:hypothetical protein